MKGSEAEKQDKIALEQFKVKDSDQNLMNLLIFSKQVETLYNEITEFDDCFPDDKNLAAGLEDGKEVEV